MRQTKKGFFLAAFLSGAAIALVACQSQPGVSKSLGTYNSNTLYYSDMEAQERNALFEAEQNTYDTAKKILENRYMDSWFLDYQTKNKFKTLAEAKDDFYAKNASVSDAEVKSFIKANESNPELKQIPKKEQDGIVRQYLTKVSRAKAEQNILQEAESSGKIRVTGFPQPVSPIVQFNSGGHIYDTNLKNPKVTVVEFADYQCPFCVQANTEIEKILEHKEYQGQVQYVFRDFPLTDKHPQAMPAAIAARCAENQGRYWGMHKALFDRGTSSLSSELYKKIAVDLKLNQKEFEECQKDPSQKTAVEADFSEGLRVGVNGTPSIYINGERYEDRISFEALKKQIDKRLAD